MGGDMSANLTGIALNFVALFFFIAMDTTSKLLSAEYPIPQLVFVRFVFHIAFVALAIRLLTGSLPWRSKAPWMQLIRSACLAISSLFFIAALSRMPLADATAVGFAAPMMTVALAALWLREKVSARRWIGVSIGFVGVVVAVRPPFLTGGPAPDWVVVLPLLNAVLYAVYQILTRKLAAVDDPRTTILYTGTAGALLMALAQPFLWQWPGSVGTFSAAEAWGLLIALGFLGAAGHGLLVMAFSRAQASVLAPITYTQLLWAMIVSALVFGQEPDRFTLAGAAIIACGGVLVALPERRRQGASA
jgi:drug/metabolite transporter (DMT)-like permease